MVNNSKIYIFLVQEHPRFDSLWFFRRLHVTRVCVVSQDLATAPALQAA